MSTRTVRSASTKDSFAKGRLVAIPGRSGQHASRIPDNLARRLGENSETPSYVLLREILSPVRRGVTGGRIEIRPTRCLLNR